MLTLKIFLITKLQKSPRILKQPPRILFSTYFDHPPLLLEYTTILLSTKKSFYYISMIIWNPPHFTNSSHNRSLVVLLDNNNENSYFHRTTHGVMMDGQKASMQGTDLPLASVQRSLSLWKRRRNKVYCGCGWWDWSSFSVEDCLQSSMMLLGKSSLWNRLRLTRIDLNDDLLTTELTNFWESLLFP